MKKLSGTRTNPWLSSGHLLLVNHSHPLPEDFICPVFCGPAADAFRSRAAEYGFIERYPASKQHITGIAHEPWHFRYVGFPHSQIMAQHGFCLEEYIDFLRSNTSRTQPLHLSLGRGWGSVEILFLRLDEWFYTPVQKQNTNLKIHGNNADGVVLESWRLA